MALTKIDDRGLNTPIDLLNNEKIRFGNSTDLEVYHTGSHGYIDNSTGSLIIRTNVDADVGGDIFIKPHDDQTAIAIIHDNAVQLFYDGGGPKFETTANGAKVTGSAGSYALEINHPDWNTLKLINTNANDYGPYLDMYHNSASPADGDEAGEIRFLANDDAGGVAVFGQMRVLSYDVSNGSEDGQFDLQLRNNDVLEEKLRIRSGGQVCIGTTDGPGEPGLYLGDGTNPAAHIYANGSDHLYILANAYYNGGWKYQGSGHAASLTIGDGDLVFNTAPTGTAGNAITWAEVFRAKNSNGDLSLTNGNLNVANSKGITALGVDNSTYAELDITVAAADGSGSNNVATFKRGTSNSVINLAFPNGGGIDFGATGGPTNSAAGTSEILADYEEGNWTPVPTAGTFSTAIGKYTRIGRLVFCSFEVVHDDGGGNYLQINGLPFSNLAQHGANLGTVGYQTGGISPVFTSVTTGTSILCYNENGTNYTYGNIEDDYFRGAVAYNVD